MSLQDHLSNQGGRTSTTIVVAPEDSTHNNNRTMGRPRKEKKQKQNKSNKQNKKNITIFTAAGHQAGLTAG